MSGATMVASLSTINFGVWISNLPQVIFFVRNGAGVGTIGGGGIRNLAEITPEGDVMPFQVLIHHGYDANREIPGYAAPDLEKPYSFSAAVLAVPAGQPGHIFDPAFDGTGFQFAFNRT